MLDTFLISLLFLAIALIYRTFFGERVFRIRKNLLINFLDVFIISSVVFMTVLALFSGVWLIVTN